MPKRNLELNQIPDMSGKICIVTGGNTGIGKICALELARKNAHVILTVRTQSKGEAAVEEIRSETNNDEVEFMILNLLSLASVRRFLHEFMAKNLSLHLLLNNAGISACPFALSEDGLESQFATNHVCTTLASTKIQITILTSICRKCEMLIKLGPFYLTTQLLPILKKSQPSRIVNVSSSTHNHMYFCGLGLDKINDRSKYYPDIAYARTKAYNILFTRELAQRLENQSVKSVYVNSVHPGIVLTDIVRHTKFPMKQMHDWMAISPRDGAITQLYLATSPDVEQRGIRGKYYVPYGVEEQPQSQSTSAQNQTDLWNLTEKILLEKVPGYTGAGI